MAEIDVAVFAFDARAPAAAGRTAPASGCWAEPAMPRLVGAAAAARDLGLAELLEGEAPRTVEAAFARRRRASGSCGAAPSAWAGCRTSWWC